MVNSLGLTSIQDKLKYFMWFSNTYGKPTTKFMQEFVKTFRGSLSSGTYAEKIKTVNNKKELDALWENIKKEAVFPKRDGGYAWYEKLAEIDFSEKTDEEIAAILQSVYVVEEKVTDASEDMQSKKQKYTMQDLEANYLYKLLNGQECNSEEIPKVPEAEHSDKSEEALSSEVSEKANEAEQSKEAKEADAARVASGLTEEGSNELFSKFMDSLMEEDSPVMGALAKKTYEIQRLEAQKEKHTYKFNDSYGGNFTTVDIYNDSLLKKANEILSRSGRLLIIGETGSGKSELAYKLISEITGESIGVPTGSDAVANYNRVCIANARNGYSFWYEDDSHVTIGKLRLFVEHIRNNNITEPCVFVGNEIQSSDFGYLMGDALFDAFNNPGRVDERLLPSNLYIIFIGCNNRNFGIDDQVYGRVEHIRLEYLTDGTSEGEVVAEKIVKNLGGADLERAKLIVSNVSKINKNEKVNNFAPVISTRELVKMLKGQKTALVAKPEDKENLTNESKQLLAKLEGLSCR